jgi:hypothetical protein
MNFCTLFGALVITGNENTPLLPGILLQHKKAVKCILFIARNHMCTCENMIECRKVSINGYKSENGE